MMNSFQLYGTSTIDPVSLFIIVAIAVVVLFGIYYLARLAWKANKYLDLQLKKKDEADKQKEPKS